MTSISRTKKFIDADPDNWLIYLMDFVDDFRHYKDNSAISEPFAFSNEKMDAILASTAEHLCDELALKAPSWLQEVPACHDPWFVSGMESLKAIAIVESPVHFRVRKFFVLENFLSRV